MIVRSLLAASPETWYARCDAQHNRSDYSVVRSHPLWVNLAHSQGAQYSVLLSQPRHGVHRVVSGGEMVIAYQQHHLRTHKGDNRHVKAAALRWAQGQTQATAPRMKCDN